MDADERLRDELIGIVASRRGHFALESGHHGDLWLDLDRLLATPETIAPFAACLAERLLSLAFDAVCGPHSGGALLAREVAARLGMTACFTDRASAPAVSYLLPDRFREVVAGRRIAVVDDAINAGHAVRGTLAALRANRAEPVAIGALIVLDASGSSPPRFDGLPLMTLATLGGSRWDAAGCPLCARGVALEEPGVG